jgi:acetyltransferase-like isoleucine patch superfamily enzyme
MLNIYGKGTWATKITSLLKPGEYAQYDENDYPQAGGNLPWIIGLEDGSERLSVMHTELSSATIDTFFKGCNNLNDVTVGTGVTVGCCSLIRPGTKLGDQVYIGAGTIIDNNCTIGSGVTIGDNVTVFENVTIPDNTNIPSGSVVQSE